MADFQPTALDVQGPPTDRLPVLQAAIDAMTPAGVAPAGPSTVAELYPGAGQDKRLHPDFLGNPPQLVDGECTACGWPAALHLDEHGSEMSLTGWHRRDSRNPYGFFANEEPRR